MEVRNEDEAGGEPSKAEPQAKSSGFRRPVKASPATAEKAPSGVRSQAPAFHPLAYRSVIAEWPVALREEWGLRANELEETGLAWRDAETQAFVELWHRHQREGQGAVAGPEAPNLTENAEPAGESPAPAPLDPSSIAETDASPADPLSSHAD